MILLESINIDLSLDFPSNQIIDKFHITIPISPFLARFVKLDQHIFSLAIFLSKTTVTFMHNMQMERLYLISTYDHSS